MRLMTGPIFSERKQSITYPHSLCGFLCTMLLGDGLDVFELLYHFLNALIDIVEDSKDLFAFLHVWGLGEKTEVLGDSAELLRKFSIIGGLRSRHFDERRS
jgi:hypothetical protein